MHRYYKCRYGVKPSLLPNETASPYKTSLYTTPAHWSNKTTKTLLHAQLRVSSHIILKLTTQQIEPTHRQSV